MRISFSTYSYISKKLPFCATSKEGGVRKEKIKSILERSIENKRRIMAKEIAQEVGCTTSQADHTIRRNKDLKSLWDKLHSDEIPSEAQKRKQARMKTIQNTLQTAKDNKEYLTLETIAQGTDVGIACVNQYILNNPDLNSLWYWTKEKEHTDWTPEEIAGQNEDIRQELLIAIKHKKAITLDEIAQKTGIDRRTIRTRIEANKYLGALRDRTQEFADKNYRLQVAAIKRVLQAAEEKGLKISIGYISRETDITEYKVQARIDENGSLDRLFQKVKTEPKGFIYTREEIAEQKRKIAEILNNAILNGTKMTAEELAAQVGNIDKNNITKRIARNATLQKLWEQVEISDSSKPKKAESREKLKRAEEFLIDLYYQGEKITLNELIEKTGISSDMLFYYMKKSELLALLWEMTCLTKRGITYKEDEIEAQNVVIERILRQRIEEKVKPSINQMHEYLDIKGDGIKKRINDNPTLLELFQKGQEI